MAMTHYLLHLVVSALIRGLIYVAIWKESRHVSALHLILLALILVVVLIAGCWLWRKIMRRY